MLTCLTVVDGDVGLAIDLSAGVHGLPAGLCVLFQSQPVIECAAGDIALRADGFVKAAAGDEAARRELGIFMGRRRAAVGQGQGLAPATRKMLSGSAASS